MKIKQVCEKTGLTDRAVRYYIEEGLIAPHYTENYLGRKAFEFSELNIRELQDISTLRDFSFSIEEIREILAHPENSQAVINAVRARTAEKLGEETRRLEALSLLDREQMYTVPELAKALTAQGCVPKTEETVHFNLPKLLLRFLKSVVIFILVWLPFVAVLLGNLSQLQDAYVTYQYPVIEKGFIGLIPIVLLPSILILIINKFRFSWKKICMRVLLILCVICIPLGLFASVVHVLKSETTAPVNYRRFDAGCLVNRSPIFQDLFPIWPHWEEEKYYYQYKWWNSNYDVYAEWKFEDDGFEEEIQRASEVLRNAAADSDYLKYTETQRGEYQCFILYSRSEPFAEPLHNTGYDYYIFAYQESERIVRYINCYSFKNYNGEDQPYYLTLDW